jgi:hypothetical protein
MAGLAGVPSRLSSRGTSEKSIRGSPCPEHLGQDTCFPCPSHLLEDSLCLSGTSAWVLRCRDVPRQPQPAHRHGFMLRT